MCEQGQIQSFVFMDLETTGLPQYNFGKSNITEIAICACLRRDLLFCKKGEIPRNMHKLVLCFNPLKRIDTESSILSGLYNDMLEPENPFDENAGNLIINFLQHLKKPVCLVAHNGFNFDFPIFKKSLLKIKIEIPDFLLCIDSFLAIKTIDGIQISRGNLGNIGNEYVIHGDKNDAEISQDNIGKLLNENIENKELTVNDDKKGNNVKNILTLQEEILRENDLITNNNNEIKIIEKVENEVNQQKLNETTPKRSTKNSAQLKKSIVIKHNLFTPVLTTIGQDRDRSNQSKCKRKLLFSTLTSSTSNSIRSLPYTLNSRGYYKLSSVYHRIFGEQLYGSHHAENDVLALQKISMSYGEEFIKYADENAIKFKDISSEGYR